VLIPLLRTQGLGWISWRALYALALRSGYFKSPRSAGNDSGLALAESLQMNLQALPGFLQDRWVDVNREFPHSTVAMTQFGLVGSLESLLDRAERIARGQLFCLGRERSMAQPDFWFRGDLEKMEWPHDVHWSSIPDLSERFGDIKEIWEPARFAFAFTLAQAFKARPDTRYATSFWAGVDGFIKKNPVGVGPHWRCGQEIALRTLAWCYGLSLFADQGDVQGGQLVGVVNCLWQGGRHIESVHWYAKRCIKNNHAISESVALITLGFMFPYLREAARWREKGLKWLPEELAWQIAPDGTYVQQSNNYARLVAQLLTWTICLLEGKADHARDLEALKAKARLLLGHLLAQMDPDTGHLPNFGSNDGALIFPWSSCEYRDFRPALHALSLATGGSGLPGTGPWEEEAFWFGLQRPETPAAQPHGEPADRADVKVFPNGGISILRSGQQKVLFRCGPNSSRPIQADMMQVDYWRGSCNILVDAGTYRYNTSPAFYDYFSGTTSHNTVMVDGKHQMRRGSRFLWLDWTQGKLETTEVEGDVVQASGHHDAYKPVRHTRTVRLEPEELCVRDSLDGGGKGHAFRLHWLLNDLPLQATSEGWEIELPDGEVLELVIKSSLDMEVEVVRDDRRTPLGIWSQNYGSLSPAVSIIVKAMGSSGDFWTTIRKVR
jgi:hypothetical protein